MPKPIKVDREKMRKSFAKIERLATMRVRKVCEKKLIVDVSDVIVVDGTPTVHIDGPLNYHDLMALAEALKGPMDCESSRCQKCGHVESRA